MLFFDARFPRWHLKLHIYSQKANPNLDFDPQKTIDQCIVWFAIPLTYCY